jgi:hypothetical protein
MHFGDNTVPAMVSVAGQGKVKAVLKRAHQLKVAVEKSECDRCGLTLVDDLVRGKDLNFQEPLESGAPLFGVVQVQISDRCMFFW